MPFLTPRKLNVIGLVWGIELRFNPLVEFIDEGIHIIFILAACKVLYGGGGSAARDALVPLTLVPFIDFAALFVIYTDPL